MLAFLFLIGLTAPVQFQAVAALAPDLIAGAGLSYTDIGIFTGLYMLPGVFLAAPTGPLAAAIGDRWTLVSGITLMAVSGAIFAMTDSYLVMFVCRVIGGAGAVAVTVLLPKLVTDWFAGREIATAMATIAASVGVGIGGTMAGLPWLASTTSWRTAMLATSALCLVSIALLLVIYRDAAPVAAQTQAIPQSPAPGTTMRRWNLSRREAALAGLAGLGRGLFSAGYAVFMSFTPALLMAQGISAVDAGLLTSVSAIASLISVPLGGYLSDRTGKPNYFIIGGSIGATLSCLALTSLAPALLWIVTFGLLRGGCTGGLMSLPARVLKPENRSNGFAVVSASYFICMFAFPAIAGWLLDVTGSPSAPILFAAILWISISALLAVFLTLERRWRS